MSSATQTELKEIFRRQGIEHWGAVPLTRPVSFEIYRAWIEKGFHGEMEYLHLHLPKKEFPTGLLPDAQSSLSVAIPYRPSHPAPLEVWPLKALPTASYARGHDYHFWLKQKLEAAILDLKALFPQAVFLAMTDSHPVMERDLGHRAGLGWFGKNTCLIDQKQGSFFLIGEIFTSLGLHSAVATAPPDLCGSCTKCLEACPTGALTAPREMDARKCISYWTIESRGIPPVHLRSALGSHFFGCDICQQVCPWNEKALGREILRAEVKKRPNREDLIDDLRLILTSSNQKLLKLFAQTPLTRAGGRGLKRNAILVAVHHGCFEVHEEIRQVGLKFGELKELCDWASEALKSAQSSGIMVLS